ncbi:unnamed protein product [Penicillium glandicola]
MAASLPFETLLQIFSYHTGHLTPCACVCRQWQLAVEIFTFADLHINSADLEDFRQTIASPHSAGRYSNLRNVYFKVILPEYSVAARGCYENEDDCDSNNRVFTQAITSLFQILSSWPDYDEYKIFLKIYARSPSDWQAEPDWTTRTARRQRGYAFPEEDLLNRRYESSSLQLTGKIALPDVRCITSFEVPGCGDVRNIAMGAVSEMVAHLPQLHTINVRIGDKETKAAAMCDILRGYLSGTKWPRSLRHLYLGDAVIPPSYERCPLPSDRGPNSMCLELYQLTLKLESVDLSQIMISPALFWPVDTSIRTRLWPNLTRFSMSYEYALPKSELPYQFRSQLKRDLENLYLVAGRAAQYMPRLNSMDLDVSILRLARYYFRYEGTSGKATWTRFSKYQVSNKVQEAWDLAAKGHGHEHALICTEVNCLV